MISLYNFDEELAKVGLTKESYEASCHDIDQKVNGMADLDWSEIKERNNINLASDTIRKANTTVFGYTFRTAYEKSKKQGDGTINIEKAQNTYKTESSINKDGTFTSDKLIAITEDELKNPSSLLKAHGFDVKEWELVSARNNIWNVYSKQDGVQELYSSKIVVKPRTVNINFDIINEWYEKLDHKYTLPDIPCSEEYLDGNKCLLIDIADLHLNLQATLFSTGNEYNCEIAENIFFYVIQNILSRTTQYNFQKIIFVVGGDMLNGDNLSGSTTKGTPQDSDTLYFDASEKLYTMTVKAVDILKQKAPVDVIYVSGNHDKLISYHLTKFIEAWFRNDDYVHVDYSPLPRKYVQFGKTLFVFAHDGNVKTLPRLIADEAREYWSDIETTEVFLQHLHTEQVLTEEYNMRIQRLPTISAKSDWTVNKGFGSKRQCKTFIFDMEDGLTDVLYTPIKNIK